MSPNSEREEANLMTRVENQGWIVVTLDFADGGKSSLLNILLHEVIKRYFAYRATERMFPGGRCFKGSEPKGISWKATPGQVETKCLPINSYLSADDVYHFLKDLIARHFVSMKHRFRDGLNKRRSKNLWPCVLVDLDLCNSKDLKLDHREILMKYHCSDLDNCLCENAELMIRCNILKLWIEELCDGLIISIKGIFAIMICHLLNQEIRLSMECFSDQRFLSVSQNDWKKMMLISRNSEKRFADWYREGPPNIYEICHTLRTAA